MKYFFDVILSLREKLLEQKFGKIYCEGTHFSELTRDYSVCTFEFVYLHIVFKTNEMKQKRKIFTEIKK